MAGLKFQRPGGERHALHPAFALNRCEKRVGHRDDVGRLAALGGREQQLAHRAPVGQRSQPIGKSWVIAWLASSNVSIARTGPLFGVIRYASFAFQKGICTGIPAAGALDRGKKSPGNLPGLVLALARGEGGCQASN